MQKIRSAYRPVNMGVKALAGALCIATAAHGDDSSRFESDSRRKEIRYEITHLERIGSSHAGSSINERGWVAGFAVLGDVRHAVLWKKKGHGNYEATDLGALGGFNLNSSVVWQGLNNWGMIAGISQTGKDEPLDEEWSCQPFFDPTPIVDQICVGFAWLRGEFRSLPTFPGGNNGYAAGVNDRGQIVGWAENGVEDPTCDDPQQLQFRAALWRLRPFDVEMTELPPLGDDATSAATAINIRGDVVGISGDCQDAVGSFSARHAVMWRDGAPTEIELFGGKSWNTPVDVNLFGEVVGFANKPGEADDEGGFNAQAFYWNEEDGATEIGALPGNVFSQARDINARGEVVGISFIGDPGARAFIWRRGDDAPTDLNSLAAPDYRGTLTDARSINEQGEITGAATDANGASVAFIARPVRR